MSDVTPPDNAAALETRSTELFESQHRDLVIRTDRMFAVLMAVQWVAGIVAALVLSPLTWSGSESTTHIHVWAAVLLGGALTAYPIFLVLSRPGAVATRHTVAISQMLMSALLIHLTGGRIETHFHIFGSLAFLAFYRDRSVLMSAAAVVVVDHLVRGIFWPESVYGAVSAPLLRTLEHASWVVFELTFLFIAVKQGVREMWAIASRESAMEAAKAHVEREVLSRTSELATAEARTRAIVETAADGIITIDEHGSIQTVNPAAEQIFGYSAEELTGNNVNMLMPSPQHEEHDGYLANYLESGEKKVIGVGREVTGLRKDGSEFPLDLAVSESRGGVFTGFVRDITERKAIDRMKTEFISTVSHELRTPLTSIHGSLGLVEGGVAGDISDKARSLIQIALNNSNRLVRLVNDILDIEKIESGKMEFRFEPQHLDEIVREAIDANAAFAEKHGVELQMSAATDTVRALVDRDRILQVLTNLLSNAAKYSPPGEAVTTTLALRDGRIRVEVTDRGPGIPEEFHSRIFGKFAQADSSDNRQKDGTGLGLSITKAIVEMHEGEVGFTTECDVGTTFYFELPAMAEPQPIPEVVSDVELPRVLVCEDDPDVAHLLTLMLQENGMKVDVAGDSKAVHALLGSRHYDAMTLDLMLPGVSGIELLNEIRNNPATRGLPVVVVSAVAEEGKKALATDTLGVINWLEKPIDRSKLARALEAALGVTTQKPDPSSKPRVLYVEDNNDLVDVVSATLDSVAEIFPARNLREAREVLSRGAFDLVLLDLELPDGSGLDLIPALNVGNSSIPVVVFSAHELESKVVDQVAASLVKSRTSNSKLIETITSLVRQSAAEPPVSNG